MGSENWIFFQAFLKAPMVVAAVAPSSPFLERRVIRAAEAADAKVVVELGTGTGGITRALLEAMGPEARLLAIERTAEFADSLQEHEDDRLAVVHGCASGIAAEMQQRSYRSADAVVSGIPFSTLPKTLAADIIDAIFAALSPGGVFVAYQFTDRVADYARPVMGAPEVELELLNFPPVRVFKWRKQGGPARMNGGEPA